MANNYYVFTPDFIPGQKVASAEMNSQLSGIESGFDALPGVANAIVKGVAYRGTEAGSGNSYTITMDDTRTAYADGDRVLFKATHTNTGASSINLDSIGLISLVLADSSATGASEILSGRFYEAVYVAASNHFQLTTPGAAATTTAALQVGYAEEWASKAEDSLVSTAAGGDGATEYSALHWAAKAAADVVLTNADAVSTAADVVLTNADVVSTNADVVTTNADAATTTQDAIDTAADAVSTAADAVSTAADVITAAASETAAGISETNAGASETAAAASETAAGLSETAAALSETNAGVSETNAAASAASINLPTISGGDTDKILEVNVAEDGYDLVARAASETATGFVELATDAEIITGTDTARAVTPANVQHKLDTEYYTQTEADTNYQHRSRTNLLRNAMCQIWQRGTTFTGISSGQYFADGWRFIQGGSTAAGDITQNTNSANDVPFRYYWTYVVTTADASLSSGDYVIAQQPLEGLTMIPTRFGFASAEDLVVRIWHAHTNTGSHYVTLRNDDATRSYVALYTQSVADTWEEATITIPGDVAGTWVKDNTLGAYLMFPIAVGSTFEGTADAWTSTNDLIVSGAENNVGTISDAFRIGKCSMSIGDIDAETDILTPTQDLAECQRYFEKSYNLSVTPGTTSTAGMMQFRLQAIASGNHIPILPANFATQKRAVPTVVMYSPSGGASSKAYDYIASADIACTPAVEGMTGFRYDAVPGTSTNISYGVQWTAASELV